MSIRVIVGMVITVFWIVFCGLFLWLSWDVSQVMKVSEWGDFIAGTSAPLAFLWLVIGYFQQGKEIGQNTEALKLQEKALMMQVEELKQSVEQQKAMVEITRGELAINKMNFENQRIKERKRAQPKFRKSMVVGEGTLYKLNIKNAGHSIQDVKISMIQEDDDVVVYFKDVEINLWDALSEQKLTFQLSAPLDTKFTLEVEYINKLDEVMKDLLIFNYLGGRFDLVHSYGKYTDEASIGS